MPYFYPKRAYSKRYYINKVVMNRLFCHNLSSEYLLESDRQLNTESIHFPMHLDDCRVIDGLAQSDCRSSDSWRHACLICGRIFYVRLGLSLLDRMASQ